MDGEDRRAVLAIRKVERDVAIEAAGPEKRRVEDVGSIRGRENDHRFAAREPIHLREDLVQGLLAFVVPAAQPRAARAPDAVELVDEQDAGRRLLRSLEEPTDAGSTHADEDLDEFGSGDRVERHARLTRESPRE